MFWNVKERMMARNKYHGLVKTLKANAGGKRKKFNGNTKWLRKRRQIRKEITR